MKTYDLDAIIKAYDVRGTVPEQWDGDLAERLGGAFVRVLNVSRAAGGPGAIVVGHDMRPSGIELVERFTAGVVAQGVDVINIGLASTDMTYFASGKLALPGAMFTASHNPAAYNGIKFCRAGAIPVGRDTGLGAIRSMVAYEIPVPLDIKPGAVTHRDMLGEYARFLHTLVPLTGIRPLKVIVDAGNGMGGLTAPKVLDEPGLEIVPLYFELDGTFPNHEANPLDPKNLVDLQAKVLEVGADLGLAFDGDADRCFVVDELGQPVSPSALTALIASREIARHPGATILHNLITSRAVPELVRELGGTPVRTEVGHSFIKAHMARTGAVFGGEHSGHYYFSSFYNADSGMVAAMHVLSALGRMAPGTGLSTLVADYTRYVASGEINSVVEDTVAATEKVQEAFAGRDGAEIDFLDGLSVEGPDWRFNLRPSNTEPLLRLNVEAEDKHRMESLRDEVLALIRP